MGKTYAKLEPALLEFIASQRLFFVGTSPNAATGHVNISPKGFDSFRVLGETSVAYADYNGSGVETIAHVRENGRIVFMFCAFAGAPKILRLHGVGSVVVPADPHFAPLLEKFRPALPVRSIICAELSRIADSCGFGVPLYAYQGEREQAYRWAEAKGEAAILDYQRRKNLLSIDGLNGLPGLDETDES